MCSPITGRQRDLVPLCSSCCGEAHPGGRVGRAGPGWRHCTALLQQPRLLTRGTGPALTTVEPPWVLPVPQDRTAKLCLAMDLAPGVPQDIRNES